MKLKYIIVFLVMILASVNAQTPLELNKRVSKLKLYRDTMVWQTIDSLIEITDKPGLEQQNINSRISKGALYYTFSKPEDGIKYLEELYQDVFEYSDLNNQYRLLTNISLGYLLKEDYSKSLDYALQSYYLAEENIDSSWLKNSAMKVGQSYILLGRKEQAIPYLIEALDIAYEQNDRIKIIQISNNLLIAHNDKLDQEPFISYFKKYLNYLNEQDIPFDSRHAGILQILETDINEKKLLKLVNNISEFDLPVTRVTLIELIYKELLKRELPFKAIDILESELNSDSYDNSREAIKNLNSYLANSYAVVGNWEKAYSHLRKHIMAIRELRGKSIQERIDSLNVLYESAKKEKQIAEQELKLSKRRRDNQVLVGSVIALLIFAGLIIHIIRRKLIYEKDLRKQEKAMQEEKLLRLEKENKIMAMDYVLLGEENERKRIAKDLHDSLGSLLSSAQLQLDKIQAEINQLQEMDLFSNAELLIKSAAKEVRRISHDMMPEALVNLGLQASVEDLASSLNISGKMSVSTFFSSFDEVRLNDKQKLGLFRIVQELTQNAIKHSNADQLIIQGSMDNQLMTLFVEDNGVGFDVEKQLQDKTGIGLQNIISRVKYLDGEIHIASKQGEQSSFQIEIPLNEE